MSEGNVPKNTIHGFFSDQGELPNKINTDDLKPKVKVKTNDDIDDAILVDEKIEKESKQTENKNTEEKKDIEDVINNLVELGEEEDITYEKVENALGVKTIQASKEEKTLGDELGIGAEEIIELIDVGRQWLYMSYYDEKINFEALEEELDDLIQKSNKTDEEDVRMKKISAFLTPARKQRQKFSDKIPYHGGVRKRLENVARIALAKLIQKGRVPEWLILAILIGFQDGKLLISLLADKKSLPRV